MRRLAFAVQRGLGAGTRRHVGSSVCFMDCNFARPCALVALMVVKLCNSRLCSYLPAPGLRSNSPAYRPAGGIGVDPKSKCAICEALCVTSWAEWRGATSFNAIIPPAKATAAQKRGHRRHLGPVPCIATNVSRSDGAEHRNRSSYSLTVMTFLSTRCAPFMPHICYSECRIVPILCPVVS
jgi:hypothetical protein